MLMNLLLGLPTMLVCLTLQSLLLAAVIRFYQRRQYRVTGLSTWSSLLVIQGVMVLLVVGNLAQIAIWALLFVLIGEFQQVSEAYYHSAVNFATLGYGDFVMTAEYKLLGPLEAVNGVLMIGVSTSVLMIVLQKAMNVVIRGRGE
jgi:hypothetical protein